MGYKPPKLCLNISKSLIKQRENILETSKPQASDSCAKIGKAQVTKVAKMQDKQKPKHVAFSQYRFSWQLKVNGP